MSPFDTAVQVILASEGVFSDDANDPGGETVYGISRVAHPDIPWPPTKDQAIDLYRTRYWDAHECGSMPWRWGLAVFDAEVNQPTHGVKAAQQALGVSQDGIVGPGTLAAMAKATDDVWTEYMWLRSQGYRTSPNWFAFGHGWIRRLMRVAYYAGVSP